MAACLAWAALSRSTTPAPAAARASAWTVRSRGRGRSRALTRTRAGVAYLSPVLAFNLSLALHLRTFLGAARPRVFVVPCASPATMRSARVALVREPAELADTLCRQVAPDTTEELEQALSDYFSVPRLAAQGDVFSVPVPDESEPGRTRTCSFCITVADPATGGVLSSRTHLLLDGSTSAAAPPVPSMGGFAHAPCGEEGEESAPHAPSTAHPHPAVAAVCALAAPLVHPGAAALRLRCAVLLKGPQGVGKRGVAQAAAAALGMNCVVFNCHELGGESEGKTAAALAQAFAAAAAYAPAVLLLRRLGALQSPATPGAVPDAGASGVKGAPLLARALEAAIRDHSHGAAHHPPGDGGDDDDDDDDDDCGDEGEEGEEEDGQGGGGGNPLAPKPRVWRAPGRRRAPPGMVLLLACCESADTLPPDVRRAFTHELPVSPPDEATRAALLQRALGRVAHCVDTAAAAAATAGLMPRDLRALAAEAAAAAAARLAPLGSGAPLSLRQAELDEAVQRAGGRTNAAIGAPKVPTVSWADVGGLELAKKTILDTVQLPLRHRALFSAGGRRRSGALLYGPPGTGKTLLVRAAPGDARWAMRTLCATLWLRPSHPHPFPLSGQGCGHRVRRPLPCGEGP